MLDELNLTRAVCLSFVTGRKVLAQALDWKAAREEVIHVLHREGVRLSPEGVDGIMQILTRYTPMPGT